MPKQVKLLFIVLPTWNMPYLTSKVDKNLNAYAPNYTVVKSREEYYKLPDRYCFEVIAAWGLPGFIKELVID